MEINELFKIIHGSMDIENDLNPITHKKTVRFIKSKNLNPDNFFETNNCISPHCYLNKENGVYIDIHLFSNYFFDTFDIVKKINDLNDYMNKLINQKKYGSVFGLMEKKIRISYFNKWYKNIPEEQTLEVFKSVYSSSEYNFGLLNVDILKYIQQLSVNELDKLDDVVKIYRGQTEKSRNYNEANSWTLDKSVAEFFSTRFNSNGKIISAYIKKEDIIAYIEDRNESEVLVFPNKIYDIKIIN